MHTTFRGFLWRVLTPEVPAARSCRGSGPAGSCGEGEEAIDLSPREVKILETLHAHPGEAVHRDALLDAAWGFKYFPESRTLDQHIAKLRKRIERDPANPEIIETVRGVGYRFRS